MSYFCHDTAVVDDGAQIGDGTRIWHFSHVSAGARVGTNVVLGQNVYVANRVTIGAGSKVQNNVSIYDNVTIEEDVFCGPSMVFTNVINPRAFVERKEEYRDTIVRKGASLGANCTIVCGVEIGEFAFVGAGAVVTADVAPHRLVVGVPARPAGWISHAGEQLDLPIEGSGTATCPVTGRIYHLEGITITSPLAGAAGATDV